jgi:hypothetical protein
MVNVPTFVDGPADPVTGFRGNGDQLYACYTHAFEAAKSGTNLSMRRPFHSPLPPLVAAGGGFNAPTLPSSIAFSFMGPSHGWDVQEAANIAISAIRDSFWGPIVPGTGGLISNDMNSNRRSFQTVSICGTFVVGNNPRAPSHLAQSRALDAAFR